MLLAQDEKEAEMTQDWFTTLEEPLWLPPDDIGEDEARFIKRALRLRRGQTVLDAPCGAGRIAFHLARAGCSVTGVDLRSSFLRRARRRFRKAELPGTFVAADMRELDFRSQFQGIYNWFGSFGYFSDEENDALVGSYSHALRPGGRLLIEQVNREYILRNFRAAKEWTKPDGQTIRIRHTWDAKSQRVTGQWTVDGKTDPQNCSSMRLYTPAQISALLQRHGLSVEDICGKDATVPREGTYGCYRRSSRRMIVAARKM